MPFCTECGARHPDEAKVCPKCHAPIAQPPNEDLDDILASIENGIDTANDRPSGDRSDPTPNYLEAVNDIRANIADQASSLQDLVDFSWDNPEVLAIRDLFDYSLERLHALIPPTEFEPAHSDFIEGVQLLGNGFAQLVDASSAADDAPAVAAAEEALAEATSRFNLSASALSAYPEGAEADFNVSDDDELDFSVLDNLASPVVPPITTNPKLTPAPMDDLSDLPRPPSIDDFDDDDTIDPLDPVVEDDELSAILNRAQEPAEEDDELPPFPPELETWDQPVENQRSSLPSLGGPAAVSFTEVEPPAPPSPKNEDVSTRFPMDDSDFAADAQANAWSTIGDPSTDSLLLEIEGGWVRGRPTVHDAIERAVRGAVADALRASWSTRSRIEQEARANLSRISGERNRLIHEVDALRDEANTLQKELTELRRGVNDLQRERQGALDRRQQIFQDAESQRARLLREIEQLGGQVEVMRRGIMSLLNMNSGEALEAANRTNVASLGPGARPVDSASLPFNIPPPTEARPSDPSTPQKQPTPAVSPPVPSAPLEDELLDLPDIPLEAFDEDSVEEDIAPVVPSVPIRPAVASAPVPRTPVARSNPTAPPAPPPRRPVAAPSRVPRVEVPAETQGELRIAGVDDADRAEEVRATVASMDGLTVIGEPKLDAGILTVAISHAPEIDVQALIDALPDASLIFIQSPEPDVYELAAL